MVKVTEINQRRSAYCSILTLLLSLFFGSCKEDDSPKYSSSRHINYRDTYASFEVIRGRGTKELLPERYLGRSFSQVAHTANDVDGFTQWSVLDEKRIAANNPWSPFGRAITPNLQAPRREEQAISLQDRFFNRIYQSSKGSPLYDTISVSVGGDYKSIEMAYGNRRYSSGSSHQHIYRYMMGYKYLYEYYQTDTPTDYEFFLHKRFVRDLKKLSAADLVQKYGTHLVTSYSTGAALDLAVAANESLFTSSEVTSIFNALWVGGTALSPQLRSKLTHNHLQWGVTYLQTGSVYTPDPLYPITSVDAIRRYDEGLFKEQINPNAHMTFLELEKGNPSIPSLISDIPLKVKYFSGILDQVRPSELGGTMYVFSNPENYEMIPYQSDYLDVIMPRYESGQVYIFIGPNAYRTFDETGRSMHRWYAQLNESGLWTFQSLKSSKYLCRDFALRTKAEDTENLRFWGLNPAIPTAELNQYSLANRFIRKG